MAFSFTNSLIFFFFSVSFFCSFPTYTASASSEVDVLLTFKESIQDPLNSLSVWSNTTSTHHCNWTGILCTTTFPPTVYSLDLQSLNLSGEISPDLCLLPQLTHLNLAYNLFNQPIPLHLSSCVSLETLNISDNLIWGTIPDQISQFLSLKVLDISRNHVEGKIPDTIASLRNLRVLNLASNLLSGTLPTGLGNFTELVVLDLSQNPFLNGQIPSDISKLNRLEKLFFQNSGFYGEIPPDFFEGLSTLSILDLSSNNLSGMLPPIGTATGTSLPNLVSFDVSQNKLSGHFPSGICQSKGLINLGLHTNFFNGSILNEIIKECSNLERFQVQNNMFSGSFPSVLWALPKLKLIRAENNKFSGVIPNSISNAVQLEQVQIDNNSFVTTVPQGLGLIRSLYRFSASQNGLYGELPPNFCDSPVMSIINLSHNYISGRIPQLKKCKKLVSLSLADNNLVGGIPDSLAELPVLTYLDLSHNNLTGSIPEELQNLKLALFNVSFNRLSGRVPLSLISGLPASFLQGNPDLCGQGLPSPCSGVKSRHRMVNLSRITVALISVGLIVALVMIASGTYMMFQSYKEKSQLNWHFVFFYPLRVSEYDLLNAMDEEASRGNGGAFGRVFVITLPSGETVAVKKLEYFGSQTSKSLKAEVKTLAKIRHKNIVKILGFCYTNDSILLIYENVAAERGSLSDHIIGKSGFHLPWNIRLRIAIGVAQGLSYLHQDYLPHLLHRNLKLNNILLDSDFVPKLTDFALDRIVGESAFRSTLASESECSYYLAPEHEYTKKATEHTDTYSFGVVLLELISGCGHRKVEEKKSSMEKEEEEESVDVVTWVRRKINIVNGAIQVLDPKISRNFQKEMIRALEIGMECTNVNPEKRPSMFEVLRMLQSIDTSTSCLPSSSSTL